jgi:hypothetical protein
MNRTLLVSVGLGVLIVGALIGGGLFVQRGARLILQGNIQKARTAALDDNRSVIVLDVRLTNPADIPFVTKSADIVVETADGKSLTGQYIPEVDAKVLFQGVPDLGEKYNQTIVIREKIAPKQTVDRMVAASFPAPVSTLESRKSVKLVLKDLDGPVSEIR